MGEDRTGFDDGAKEPPDPEQPDGGGNRKRNAPQSCERRHCYKGFGLVLDLVEHLISIVRRTA